MRRRRRSLFATVTIYPLFVIELVMVIYLLPQSGQGDCCCIAACDWPRVPFAHHTAELEQRLVVELRPGRLRLDGRQVASLAQLTDELVALHDNWSLLHPSDEFSPVYLIYASAGVRSGELLAAQRAAAAAGYTRPQYVVETWY